MMQYCKNIYFHRGKKECDFLIKQDLEITAAIQVTCSLSDPHTKEREISGLLEAMQTYQLPAGLILTLDESDSFELNEAGRQHTVNVMPIWKWLLGYEPA